MYPALSFIGGDLRSIQMAELFASRGASVCAYGLDLPLSEEYNVSRALSLREAVAFGETLLLPLPVCAEKGRVNAPLCKNVIPADDLLALIRPEQLVIGGKFPADMLETLEERGVRCVDFARREDFAVANAVPTAEGALALAMEALPVTLHGARVLITGFGRIGRILAADLRALGAHVTAAARSSRDLAWAEAEGVRAVRLPSEALMQAAADSALVINTVPFAVLDAALLAALPHDAVVIDLASRPGGVDFAAAEKMNIKTIWALSLPGKVAPVTAARIMATTVERILSEEGGA